MTISQCGEVLRGAICPRCQKRFYICRHCDRGQVYCCRQCSAESRCEKCRRYRRVYRHSIEGRLDHRDRERARRASRTKKNAVGDQGYGKRVGSVTVATRTRMAAAVAAIGSVGAKGHRDDYIYCEFCGCRSQWVYFGDGTTHNRNRNRVFRYSG